MPGLYPTVALAGWLSRLFSRWLSRHGPREVIPRTAARSGLNLQPLLAVSIESQTEGQRSRRICLVAAAALVPAAWEDLTGNGDLI